MKIVLEAIWIFKNFPAYSCILNWWENDKKKQFWWIEEKTLFFRSLEIFYGKREIKKNKNKIQGDAPKKAFTAENKRFVVVLLENLRRNRHNFNRNTKNTKWKNIIWKKENLQNVYVNKKKKKSLSF